MKLLTPTTVVIRYIAEPRATTTRRRCDGTTSFGIQSFEYRITSTTCSPASWFQECTDALKSRIGNPEAVITIISVDPNYSR